MEKITLYYFTVLNSLTKARGENVKLLLVDAGLEHDYVRVEGGESWMQKKELLKEEKGAYSCTLPYIEIDQGDQLKRFFKTVPIMRYISAKLGYKYHGSTPEETQFVDVVTELTEVWFEKLKKAAFTSEEARKHHFTVETPQELAMFDKYYSDYPGPYLLGDKFTYADILVYHMIDDDMALDKLENTPHLAKFVEAFEQRPNIKPYLASLKQ
ncbi:glutathione S-transferase [Gilbertella persicaria]|uniref:glutathione S-transferase n=1 Tax=Gilbertella persicaria TaxID=101096 RepID=UPI00221F844F|nr:glutathione S-transferase [Gilbertella persicaria]KAI8049143.1 glutathione S-transferase [Gilbertella persicaria]